MGKIKIGKHEVELYDGIESLPVSRFHRYNKMLLIDSGIGSDIADFDRHIAKAMRYLASKDTDKAATELANLRQCVHMVQQGLSPRHLAFAALVRTIDGKPRGDISDDGLKETAAMLADATEDETAAAMGAAKKKIDMELRAYFPGTFEDAGTKEYHDIMKRRAAAMLEAMQGDAQADKEADRLTGELLTFSDPKRFDGKDNAEVAYDKQFEDMCLLISKEMHATASEMTVMQFYCALERLQAEAKRARQQMAKFKK